MKIYLERAYHYRTPSKLFAVGILLLMASFCLWPFLTTNLGEEVDKGRGFAFFLTFGIMGTIGIFCLYGALRVLYLWVTDAKEWLVISDQGVEYRGNLKSWDHIKWLSVTQQRRGEFMLFYQNTGFGPDRHLPVTPQLSEEEIVSLLDELRPILESQYKHLRIG